MSDVAGHQGKSAQMKGVFERTKEYRDTCKSGCLGGYHGNRWNAHHVLPAEVFKGLPKLVMDNLMETDFDINKKYALCGLPKLTAFILWAQDLKDANGKKLMPYEDTKETTVTMQRWGTVHQYKNELSKPITYPGDFPVHNPVNWGHHQYDEDVAEHLQRLFDKMLELAEAGKHFDPKEAKQDLLEARKKFWKQLITIPTSTPAGACGGGIKANLRNRYGSAKDGWWKVMCMVENADRPVSPSLA